MVLRLPHGGGKHGGDTAEADEGGRNAVALGLLAAQRTRTGLWRRCQGRAAQTSSKRCERVQHKKGRRACAAEKITACDYGQSPNLARPGATFLRRPSRRPAWRQIPCCRARHRALVNIAASCGRALVIAGRTRCAPPCARHAPLFCLRCAVAALTWAGLLRLSYDPEHPPVLFQPHRHCDR